MQTATIGNRIMKVKDLIKKLKNMPQEYEVKMRDHDQSDDDPAAPVNHVDLSFTEGDKTVFLSA